MIEAAAAVLVIWTPVSRRSVFVKSEASLAQKLNKYIPLSVNGCNPPLGLDQENYLDISKLLSSTSFDCHQIVAAIERKKELLAPAEHPGRSEIASIEAFVWSLVSESEKLEHVEKYLELFGRDATFSALAVKRLIGNRIGSSEMPPPNQILEGRPRDSSPVRPDYINSPKLALAPTTVRLIEKLWEQSNHNRIDWKIDKNEEGPFAAYETEGYLVWYGGSPRRFSLFRAIDRAIIEDVPERLLLSHKSTNGLTLTEMLDSILKR